MIKKITLFTMILLFCIKSTFADPIKKKTAILVANKWINNIQQGNTRLTQKSIASIKEVYHENSLVYYLINFNEGGFVIVSADDATKPILGYSNKGKFDTSLDTPQMKDLLNAYKSFVYESAKAQKSTRIKATKSAWSKILNSSKSKIQKRTTKIVPFMDDILFTQSSGFEKFCPNDNDGQAIVGCVATAMSQVMRYWEFPSTGKGQISYNHNKYGNLSVNFEEQNYNWDAMSKTRADNENAKLSYHAGVAVRMNYGTSANGGSGAYSAEALSALKRNFKYSNEASMVYRYRYSDQEWNNLIKEQLNEKRPVLYSGRSKNLQDPNSGGAGHLFALDGYDTTDQGDFFHINWGWAGRSNGYFYLTEMITHGGKYNWIDNNAIMINLYPSNVAPNFTSNPVKFIRVNSPYSYQVEVVDENRKDNVNLSVSEIPSWLTLNTSNDTYTLEGTPSENDFGTHKVIIEATDGTNTTKHEFDVYVLKNSEVIKSTIIDFETGDFSQADFSKNETHPFSVINNSNHFSQSNSISDNQESVLSLTKDFNIATNLKFDYSVSSESGYDFLIFKIDGKVINKWSGEVSWTNASFRIPAGEHTLSWSYKKDGSVKKGNDLAMVDNITYQTIGLDEEAPSTPDNLEALNITETSLNLNWNFSTDNVKVKEYNIYQDNIKVSSTEATNFALTGLNPNTKYIFSVAAVDYAGNESKDKNEITITTLNKSISYCESKGNRIKYEWIDLVSFGDMTNTTGHNNGYADFTNLIATVTAGNTNDLTISADFSGSTYKEFFSVWIDYNQDGNFEESERVVNTSTKSKADIVTSIKIPDNAMLGSTRMRVSMKYNSVQNSCELFDDGEVEDYTVNIVKSSARQSKTLKTNNNVLIGLQIYPNPVSKFLNIRTDKTLKNAHYKIIDTNGKTVDEDSFSPSINIEKLKIGVYFIRIYDENTKYSKPFIKSRK